MSCRAPRHIPAPEAPALDWLDDGPGCEAAMLDAFDHNLDFDPQLLARVWASGGAARWAIHDAETDEVVRRGDSGTGAEAKAQAGRWLMAEESRRAGGKVEPEEDATGPDLRLLDDEAPPESIRHQPSSIRESAANAVDEETRAHVVRALARASELVQAPLRAIAAHGRKQGYHVEAMVGLIRDGVWSVEEGEEDGQPRAWLVRRFKYLRTHLVHCYQKHDAKLVTLEGLGFCAGISEVIWSWHFGPMPRGWQAIHIDGDRYNATLANLQAQRLIEQRWPGRVRYRYGEPGLPIAEATQPALIGPALPPDVTAVLARLPAQRDEWLAMRADAVLPDAFDLLRERMEAVRPQPDRGPVGSAEAPQTTMEPQRDNAEPVQGRLWEE